jgi:hypothetical protein
LILHPVSLVRKFFNIEVLSAEEQLATAYRDYGPFVAIGKPGEWLATPGADRMYVPNRQWQQIVVDYLKQCRVVVLQPADSEGIRWEMEQAFIRVPRRRILLSMLSFGKRSAAYTTFRSWLEERFGVQLPPTIPSKNKPWFVYFDSDGTPCVQWICHTSPLLWSFTGNAVDIDRTFHTFIQGLRGVPQEPPREPIWRPLQAFMSVFLSALAPGTMLVLAFLALYSMAPRRTASDVQPPVLPPAQGARPARPLQDGGAGRQP